VPTTVRVTVHPDNLDDLPAVAELLLEQIGLPRFGTNSVSSLGTHAKYPCGIFLTPAQRLRAMRVLAELDAKYPNRIGAMAGPLADWHNFHAMEAHRISGEPTPGRGCLASCGGVFEKLAVRADGAYVPCATLPQMVLGYIGTDALTEVWRNAPALRALRQRRKTPLASFAECQGCEYMPFCAGGCPGTALSLVGEANRPSPDSCFRLWKQVLDAEGLSPW
jgi:SynChlorMet cassette radical SAM/SPASM protein ScmE